MTHRGSGPGTDMPDTTPQAEQPLVLVTGPSGAGRSTAINVLEDLGFEAIDNLPLSLVRRLLKTPSDTRPLAIGIDVRNRDFSADKLAEVLDWLSSKPWIGLQVLYLEASEDALVRRYSETRRRHPLAPGEAAVVGIRAEAQLLGHVRDRADILIDTTDFSPHDLKAALTEWFGRAEAEAAMGITVQSFSYKRGIPKGLDLVFDVRFLRNPYWQPDLRPLTGLDPAVRAHVEGDPRYSAFLGQVTDLLLLLLPGFRDEGKAHLSIGFGCTGGRHRSVALTETVADRLAEAGWRVSKRHREQERWPLAGAGGA